MKILPLVLFLLVGCEVYGQTEENNTIFLQIDTTAEANYLSFSRYILERGYDIESRDNDLLFINTGVKTSKGGGREIEYTLQVLCLDKKIRIKAKLYFMGESMEWYWHDTGFMGGNAYGIAYYGKGGIEELIENYSIVSKITFETL